jgi:hypothetical protein
MKRAVGLPRNETAPQPRAFPWSGMNQALGLHGDIGPKRAVYFFSKASKLDLAE